MPHRLTCTRGHQWEFPSGTYPAPAGTPLVCPECGAAALGPEATSTGTGAGGSEGGASFSTSATSSLSEPGIAGLDLTPSRDSPESSSTRGPPRRPAPAVAGYEILGELGRGGMGVVYKARQTRLNRLVALKMILAGAHATQEEQTRFRIEAEAVARLQHPNVVQIYEVGEHDGFPYLALEYVGGGTLLQKTGDTPQPPRAAAELVETLARAIHHAHQHGIIHRDLKPGNVLLADDGTPKVSDFGLAKRLDAEATRTQLGFVLGTPGYMAPEQAAGTGKVGPAADVYGLGAILYKLLTGRQPFRGATPLETMHQVLEEEPVPLSSLRPRLPADLQTICLKCLRKDPAARYASALALAEDLHHFLAGEAVQARPLGKFALWGRWCRRHPGVAGLTAALGFVLFTAAVGGFLAAVRFQKIARREELARAAADQATRQAEARAEETRRELMRQYLTNGARLEDQGDRFSALLWLVKARRLPEEDPDRRRLHQVRLAASFQDSPRLVQMWFHEASIEYAEFSPDGRRLVTAALDGTARIWDPATGAAVTPPLKHGGAVFHAAFSPDGRRLLTASADGTARLWDARTGAALGPPVRHRGAVWHVAFSPDGSRFLTTSADGSARVWDARTLAPLTPPLKHDGSVPCGYFSPDGRLVVTACDDHTVRLWEVARGAETRWVGKHEGPVLWARFSPDRRLVLSISGDGTGCLWETSTGKLAVPPLKHSGLVRLCNAIPESGNLVKLGSCPSFLACLFRALRCKAAWSAVPPSARTAGSWSRPARTRLGSGRRPRGNR